MLKGVYPEYDWLPWKFIKAPDGFWADKKNQRIFIQWVSQQLNIKEMSDWYKVSRKVLKKFPRNSWK